MVFNGCQPLVQRCDGNDTSLQSRTKPRFQMMYLLTSGYFQALKLSEEAEAEWESLKGNNNTVISFTESTFSLLNIGYLFIQTFLFLKWQCQ